MAKWRIEVYTSNNHYDYETDYDNQKTEIINREKKKTKVIEIFVNRVRVYKK